jgi:aspartate aminotransferase
MSHIIDSQRLQGIEESSTLTLNALAKKMKSEGKDVINLTAGEPDFPTPSNIIRAAQEALGRGETRYLPTAGLPQLREAVAKLSSADYRYPFQANHVLISNGVKQALFSLLQSLINPGDEVIFPAPYWLSYPPMVKLAGGTPIVWQLQAKNNFLMQPETIRPLLTARTKAIIINSPSNPSGAVQDRLRLEKLIEELKGRNIYLIFDDIYDKITFAPHQWVSPFSLKGIDPDYLMSVNGVSKSYAMTGFRIGWVLASAARVARLSSWQSHATALLCGPRI